MFFYTRNGKHTLEGMRKDGSFTTDKSEWVKFTESQKLSMGWQGKPYNAQYDGNFTKVF